MKQFDSAKWTYANYIVLLLAVVLLYYYRYGLGVLNPENFGWLMKHDWAGGYLSWAFYRFEPWGFPIGHINNYLYPVGSNVGFTEIPLTVIPLKLLSPLLPENFQYVGIFLFLCHILLGYWLIKLFDLFGVRGPVQLIAVLIIVFNPMLLHRHMHSNLCVHFLFIGGFWVYFLDPRKYSPLRQLVYQGILFLLAGLINAQMGIMQSGFFFCHVLRLWKFDHSISFRGAVAACIAVLSVLFLAWYVIGFFEFSNQGDLSVRGGYGLYSLNLNSLYNAGGWSILLPELPWVSWHQYESFMYLGFGMILLILVLLLLFVGRFVVRKIKHQEVVSTPLLDYKVSWTPLWLLVIACTLVAITNVVSFNDQVLFKIPLPRKVLALGDIVRSSARFFWVVYYLILFFSILFFIRLIKYQAISGILLAGVFALQLYDYKFLLTSDASTSYAPYHTPLTEEKWNKVFAKQDNFIFYPPYGSTYLTDTDYRYFCYFAAKARKPINLGYAGRTDDLALTIYYDGLKRDMDHAVIEKNALYITTLEFIDRFIVPYQDGVLGCAKLDGYYLLYPKELETDPAFSDLGREAPRILREKRTFSPFTLSSTDAETPFNLTIDRLDRSERNLFLNGAVLMQSAPAGTEASILLKSPDDHYFLSIGHYLEAQDSIEEPSKVSNDSIFFTGTYFTDELALGNYKIGVYLHPTGKDKVGSYRFFGTINIGYPDFFQAQRVPPVEKPKFHYWFDEFEEIDDHIKLRGWAFVEGQSSYLNRIDIMLRSGEEVFFVPTDPNLRPDVTSYFNSAVNLETSGFITFISKKGLKPGDYEVGVRITNDKTHQEVIEYSGRWFNIKESTIEKP